MKTARRVLAALGAVIFAAALVGCGEEETALTPVPHTESEAYRMWEEAKEEGYEGGYLDFLSDFDFPEKEEAYPVQRALASAVQITATFSRLSGRTSVTTASGGAGIVWSADRESGDLYIVTNYHVIYDADSLGRETVAHVSDDIAVSLYGGSSSERLSARFVGGSKDYDVALLLAEGDKTCADGGRTNAEIVAESAAEPASFADSDELLAGERVFAVGNPDGQGLAVTEGIVSVEAESVTLSELGGNGTVTMLEIRTDAAVNHGNSGGGLFDAEGNLVGLVNARSEKTGVEAFGYAIPSNLVAAAVENIFATGTGYVSRATLGITVFTSASVAVKENGVLRIHETVEVDSVEADGAADGILLKGDVILSLSLGGEEREIRRRHMLTEALLDVRLGDTVVLRIRRGDEELEAEIVFDSQDFFAQFD